MVMNCSFPETQFIAVTAYQNEEVNECVCLCLAYKSVFSSYCSACSSHNTNTCQAPVRSFLMHSHNGRCTENLMSGQV